MSNKLTKLHRGQASDPKPAEIIESVETSRIINLVDDISLHLLQYVCVVLFNFKVQSLHLFACVVTIMVEAAYI